MKLGGFQNRRSTSHEVTLHDWFLACPCRVDDPEQADFFFVPQYTGCLLNTESLGEAQSDGLFRDLVQRLPYFGRSGGRDHIFVWSAGFGVDGPHASWRSTIRDAVFLMTEPELWNPYANVSQPGFNASTYMFIWSRKEGITVDSVA